MFSQMITAHKAFITNRAGKTLFTRVGSQMSLELIAPRKSFATKQPIANEWPFTGVPSQMRFEMAGFTIDFACKTKGEELV